MFNVDVDILSRDQLHQQYAADQNAYGAIRFAKGYGLNPIKLALGYKDLLSQVNVSIYSDTPALSIEKQNHGHIVHTPQGNIRAKKIVLASNGYTPKGLHPVLNNKTLPVLSQVIVTRPLTDQELSLCQLQTNQVIMDTRALKYYYRKLPDKRILFGGRGAITGKSAEDPYYAERLLAVLKSSYPSLKHVSVDYAWAGWISVALDEIPHVYQNAENNVFYATGYCGSGVSFTCQAGKRLADKVAGSAVPNIPLYQTPLPHFPLPAFRRVGQWAYFQYGRFKDAYF